MSSGLNLTETELLELDATFVSAAMALGSAESALIDAQNTVERTRKLRDETLKVLEAYETERKQVRAEGVGLGILLAMLGYWVSTLVNT